MSTTLPLVIQLGALPPSVQWTPQQLGDALVARMSIVTSQSYALFVTGSTAPTSNVGPWFKTPDNEWYGWSDTAGAYVPISIVQASLGYIISSAAPDPLIYQFWIETTVGGSPLAIKIYYSGAWVDVYATTFASYSTTTQMNAAIAAAVSGASFPVYPAKAGILAAQTIDINNTYQQLTLNVTSINPVPAPFNIVSYRYIAPAAGIYQFAFKAQIDDASSTPATLEINVAVYKNGVLLEGSEASQVNATPSRWVADLTSMVSLAANDYLEMFVKAEDGVNTGDIEVLNVSFTVNRISA